jgi:hypothetical protein
MNHKTLSLPLLIASVVGIAFWFLAALLTNTREPWDASSYWIVVYPLALIVCAVLGYKFPDRPWRWAFVLFEAQFVAMCVRNGELGNLWPLGMAIFAVLALPDVLAGKVAAHLSQRSQGSAAR